MSEAIKKIIGDELYQQIIDKGVKPEEFDLINNYVPKDNHIPRTRFNEINDELKITKGKLTDFEKQLEDAKKILGENEELKTKYADLETNFKEELSKKDIEVSNISKRSLVKEKLITSGARHVDLLMKEIKLDEIALKDGKLDNFDKQFESIKENYGDMFVKVEKTQENNNNNSSNTNANNTTTNKWDNYVNGLLGK